MTTATASIADLKNAPVPREARLPSVSPGFGDLQSFELLQRTGKLLASSPLVPEIYRGPEGVASCVIALDMALRLKASVLMVMQNLDIIHGRPSWRAQFLIATFNQCGRFSSVRYQWQGKEGTDDWGARAYATDLSTGEKCIGPLVTVGLAKAEGWYQRTGSKWKTIPELMLTYRAASWFIRTTAPELSMGLPTAEEVEDRYIDVSPETGEVLSVDGIERGEHAKPAEPTPAVDRVASDGAPTYAFIEDKLAAASSGADFALIADLIRSHKPEEQRDELQAKFDARQKELAAQAAKK